MDSQSLPFISVVIPAYNEEKNLPHALKALTNQTYPKDRYEIIIANNNSTDKTGVIGKEFGAKVVDVPQQGYVHAVSAGYSHAKGEIIAGTDSDSVVPGNWLESIAHVFEDKKVVAFTGSVKSDVSPEFLRVLVDQLYGLLLSFTFAIGNPNLGGYNMAFRVDTYNKVGGVDKSYKIGADTELGRRMAKKGKVVFKKNIQVKTSARRWKDSFSKTLWKYVQTYIYVHYLHKAVPDALEVIR